MNKTAMGVGLSACIVLSAALKACYWLESPESHYATFSDAVRDGVIHDGGWFPKWIPESATDIHEIHDIDTNATLLAFQFERGSLRSVEQTCSLTGRDQVPRPREWLVNKARWWNSGFLAGPPPATRYFVCPEAIEIGGAQNKDETWLAIDDAKGYAYFWR